jgi:hypothetical protein
MKESVVVRAHALALAKRGDAIVEHLGRLERLYYLLPSTDPQSTSVHRQMAQYRAKLRLVQREASEADGLSRRLDRSERKAIRTARLGLLAVIERQQAEARLVTPAPPEPKEPSRFALDHDKALPLPVTYAAVDDECMAYLSSEIDRRGSSMVGWYPSIRRKRSRRYEGFEASNA